MQDTKHKVTMEVEITVDGNNDRLCSCSCFHIQSNEEFPDSCELFRVAVGNDWYRCPACLAAIPATSDDKD